ncbi:MAG: YrhK family protein [Pseudomonadota bacterium]
MAASAKIWVSFGISLAFIGGCICFYFESLYIPGVTLFLIGSVLMLVDSFLLLGAERAAAQRTEPPGDRTNSGS